MYTVQILCILSEHVSATCNSSCTCVYKRDSNTRISQSQDNHLHFFFQTRLTTEEDHAISNRKVIGQGGATSDQHGVDSV